MKALAGLMKENRRTLHKVDLTAREEVVTLDLRKM